MVQLRGRRERETEKEGREGRRIFLKFKKRDPNMKRKQKPESRHES